MSNQFDSFSIARTSVHHKSHSINHLIQLDNGTKIPLA